MIVRFNAFYQINFFDNMQNQDAFLNTGKKFIEVNIDKNHGGKEIVPELPDVDHDKNQLNNFVAGVCFDRSYEFGKLNKKDLFEKLISYKDTFCIDTSIANALKHHYTSQI